MKKIEDIKHVKFEDVPETWDGRCSGDGYDTYTDPDGVRIYSDNDIPVRDLGVRPCAKCKEYPTGDGDDACIGNLGRVMNACCGHGKHEGYVQFDNGITIRGHFKVERDKPYGLEYEIRPREEIFNRIKELEADNSDGHNSQIIDTLKWTMQMD